MTDIWPDNKTRAQLMQEITICWQMIEQQKAEIERLRQLITVGHLDDLLAENQLLRSELEAARARLDPIDKALKAAADKWADIETDRQLAVRGGGGAR